MGPSEEFSGVFRADEREPERCDKCLMSHLVLCFKGIRKGPGQRLHCCPVIHYHTKESPLQGKWLWIEFVEVEQNSNGWQWVAEALLWQILSFFLKSSNLCLKKLMRCGLFDTENKQLDPCLTFCAQCGWITQILDLCEGLADRKTCAWAVCRAEALLACGCGDRCKHLTCVYWYVKAAWQC